MNELKPCPFCGKEAELWFEFVPYQTEYEYEEINLYHCGCAYCGIQSSVPWDKREAIEAWNRRVSE